jgi:hypothetical protein
MDRIAAAALAAAALGAAAAPAQADTTFALGATGFAQGADGWSEEAGECVFTLGGNDVTDDALCRVDSRHDATSGAPEPGSLETFVEATAAALTLFEGRSALLSPPFDVEAAGPATLRLHLRSRIDSLVAIMPSTALTAELVQGETVVRELGEVTTFTASTEWEQATVDLGALDPGTYRLRLRATFTTTFAQAALIRQALGIDSVTATIDDGRASEVTTLAPTEVSERAATLNARVRSDAGAATDVAYELRRSGAAEPATVPAGQVPAGETAEPLATAATGLEPCTDYEVRAVGTTPAGPKRGDAQTFTTKCPGPAGDAGGAGAGGAAGASGTAGATGAAGATTVLTQPTDPRRLLRIDATTIRVPTTGRFKGRGRVRIFCRRSTVALCNGLVKVRTVDAINPASRGTRPKRRVTFVDSEYQLPRAAVGYGIFQLNQQRLDLLRRRGSVRVRISVTVLDANNNRQTLTKVARLTTGRY